MTAVWRIVVALLIAVGLMAAAYLLAQQPSPGPALSLSVIFGALFGFVLQRSRFCFFCIFWDWFERRDPNGLLGIVTALAVGVTGYTIIYGAWLPDPASGRLPPDAFIGPVSAVLVLAGLAFGTGMAVSGSCVSAHLYRLGEGSPTAPFALVGTALGFVLGFWTWNSLYLAAISDAPVLWLPRWLGYSGALALSLAILGGLAVLLLRHKPPATTPTSRSASPWHRVFVARWPAWAGGLAVGAIGTAAYLRVGPLGVTAEIGGRARQLANAWGLLPARLEGLDTFRGCVIVVRDALMTPNGAFVTALILGSLAAALSAGQFQPKRPTLAHVTRGLAGGVLLGWGAMTGLGCTIGTLLSGIMAGAVSGWVFGIAVFAAVTIAFRIERRWHRPSVA